MNFTSLTFWASLVLGFAFLSLLRLGFRGSRRYDRFAFLVLSLFLLGMESLETVAIFGWVAAIGYVGLFCWRRDQLFLVGVLMLAPLTYYKYGGFLAEIFSGERSLIQAFIPMGISFYTFQILSFVIDSFRRGGERTGLVDYFNFASFFPQIVAGPIERRKDLLPQVEGLKFVLRREDVEGGIPWIVLGLFLKLVLAENLALIDSEMREVAVNAVQVWLEAVFFTFRIYFDFAGYSFIALGLARALGVRLTLNFRSPYLARNLQEFWRQWHVTLSRWFRDYLYFPMGGSRKGFLGVNLLVVFLVSGLWHGAGWNFLVWGGLHGVAVLSCVLMGSFQLPRLISWFVTMSFVTISWIFFKETSWEFALGDLRLLTDFSAYQLSLEAMLVIFGDQKNLILAGVIVLLVILVMLAEEISLRRGVFYDVLLNRWVQLFLIVGIFFLSPAMEGGFIYFNF